MQVSWFPLEGPTGSPEAGGAPFRIRPGGRRAIFDAGHIWALERGADGAGDCFLLRGPVRGRLCCWFSDFAL